MIINGESLSVDFPEGEWIADPDLLEKKEAQFHEALLSTRRNPAFNEARAELAQQISAELSESEFDATEWEDLGEFWLENQFAMEEEIKSWQS